VAGPPFLEELLDERKAFAYTLLSDESHVRQYGMYQRLWKALLLTLIQRSAANGKVLYPLMPQAIKRALAANEVSMPKQVESALGAAETGFKEPLKDVSTALEGLEWVKALDARSALRAATRGFA
jgi:hypothetical protein